MWALSPKKRRPQVIVRRTLCAVRSSPISACNCFRTFFALTVSRSEDFRIACIFGLKMVTSMPLESPPDEPLHCCAKRAYKRVLSQYCKTPPKVGKYGRNTRSKRHSRLSHETTLKNPETYSDLGSGGGYIYIHINSCCL